MLQKVEPRSNATSIGLVEASQTSLVDDEIEHDDGLLHVAVPIMVAAYGAAIGIAALTFIGSRETYLSLGICVAYMAMYFGIPVMMARIRSAHDSRWIGPKSVRPSKDVEVFSGPIGRIEALLQMVIVPLSVTLAFAAFAIIWTNI